MAKKKITKKNTKKGTNKRKNANAHPSKQSTSKLNVKKNSKKKDKDKGKKKDKDKKKKEKPKKKYRTPKPYSIARIGLEVYRTDEENFKPYVSSGVVGATPTPEEGEEEEETDEENTEEEEEEAEEETEEDNQGFKFHQGEILDTYYYGNLQSDEHEYDYKDMSDSASFKIETIDKMRFYKGVRVCLKGEWEAPAKTLTWDDLEHALTGFIIEQTFSESGVAIKLAGYSKLLDQTFKFEFSQMKRSEILKEIIKTAGLNPVIDVEGLDDDVTDFSNLSNNGDSSELSGGQGEAIDSLVRKWCKGKSGDLDKAQAIHAGLRDDVGIVYQKYYDSKYHTPESCLKHAHDPGLNCGDTAILTTACMKSGGLTAYIVLRCDSAHYFTVIEINGTKYYSDLTWSEGARSQRAWNDVWEGNTCGNKYDLS